MDERQTIVSTIRSEVQRLDGDGLFREPLVGFSDAYDPLYRNIKDYAGEQHLLPEEILPEVKTIVSFFIPLSKKVIDTHRKSKEVPALYAQSYIAANRLINHISSSLAEGYIARGIPAGMVPSTHTYDPNVLKAAWSHRSAAYIAGLGTFGLNRLLITEKGCAGRFGTVFLSLELPADRRIPTERCLFFKNGSCRYCQTRCPVSALRDDDFERFTCNRELLRVNDTFPESETTDVCGKCLMGPCALLME